MKKRLKEVTWQDIVDAYDRGEIHLEVLSNPPKDFKWKGGKLRYVGPKIGPVSSKDQGSTSIF